MKLWMCVLSLVVAFGLWVQPPHSIGEHRESSSAPPNYELQDTVIDHGDPNISDDHESFMDRGRRYYQDLVGGSPEVNVVSGNLTLTRQDLYIPSLGPDIEITFTYNSGSFFDGRYGYGWQLNYNLRYVTNSINENVIVVREDDRTDIFVKQSNGSFKPTYGVRDSLSQLPVGYLLTTKQGTEYYFDSPDHHYVTWIEDSNHNQLSFTYGPFLELTTVTDGTGRELTFHYSTSRLDSIVDPNLTPQRVVLYEYDGNDNLVRVINPLGDTTGYEYSADGCHDLISITDARGNAKTIEYNTDFQVQSLVSCCGSWAFAYDLENKMITVTDALGDGTTYTYDAHNRVTQIEDGLGTVLTRTWDDDYNMTSDTDANGHTTEYEYDECFDLIKVTNPVLHFTVYTYEPTYHKVASRTDPLGWITSYEYDTQGNRLRRINPVPDTVSYTYDALGQRLTFVNENGDTTRYSYDLHGNLIDIENPLGGHTSYLYDGASRRLRKVNPNMDTTRYEYDYEDRLTGLINGLDDTTRYEYDPVGNLISETDCRSYSTDYEYDGLNRLIKTFNALEDSILREHDPVGNLITFTDENGHFMDYQYDLRNRLISAADAESCTTNYEYDPVGNRISTTDGNGHITQYEYDSLNRLIKTTDAVGCSTKYEYDPVGNRIEVTNSNGNITQYEYDSLNRLIRETDALGRVTQIGYDGVGNTISLTNANGVSTEYRYDALDRLVEVIDAMGYETEYEYDALGNPLRVIDANGCTALTYTYDPLGRRLTVEDALDRTVRYTYDCVGNMISRVSASGDSTTYEYDPLNRLIIADYYGTVTAEDITYQYDHVGNVVQIIGADSDINYGYDGVNRLTSETWNDFFGFGDKTISYEYDCVGNRITMTDPEGTETHYDYDSANRLTMLENPAGELTGFNYDCQGQLIRKLYYNGIWTDYEYDALNRVVDVRHFYDPPGVTISRYTYTYDGVGNRLSCSQDRAGLWQADSVDIDYEYDPLNRLISADYDYTTGGYRDYRYEYDGVGNRLQKIYEDPWWTDTTDYSYDGANQLISEDGFSYSYDNNGNRTSMIHGPEVTTYAHDYENRVTQIMYPSGLTSAFQYSPSGKRLSRTDPGDATNYYFYEGLDVMTEYDAVGSIHGRYLRTPGNGMLISADFPAKSDVYYHLDGLFSVGFLTGVGGNVLDVYEYAPYGDPLYFEPVVPSNHYYFQSRYWDPDCWLYFDQSFYLASESGISITKSVDHAISRMSPYVQDYDNPMSTGLVSWGWQWEDNYNKSLIYMDICHVMAGPDGGGGGKKKKCGVEKFEVKVKPSPADGGKYAGFRIDVTIKFKTGNDWDPACCEYRQDAADKWEIKGGPHKNSKGQTPMEDDNYSRADDTDGKPGMNDPGFTTNDNPGWTAVGGNPIDPNDDLDYSFTCKQKVIDICNGNAVVATKGPKTFTIKGKHPRTFDPANEIKY